MLSNPQVTSSHHVGEDKLNAYIQPSERNALGASENVSAVIRVRLFEVSVL